MMDRFRWLGRHVGWQPAAAVALMLLGLTSILRRPNAQYPRVPPSVAQTEDSQGQSRSAPRATPPTTNSEEASLGPDDDLVRTHSPDGEQLLLRTFSLPDVEDGLRCVDAVNGRVKWQCPPVCGGRYTYVRAGEFTLVECSGFPEENTLAVRRLSDGHILGRAWTLGRLYDFAISGRRVATVEPIVILHGREIPVTSEGETPDGPEATRVRVYDEWGHVLSSRHVAENAMLTSLLRGFAVEWDTGKFFLSRRGQLVAKLR